ncbi:MAG TPA: TetR/AcrR family transcriptional regulator [Alphaproteobacteria bacterium]
MGGAAQDRQPRRRKAARPQEILDAALREFATNGYAATRLEDVARRAGISKGTIYLYFANKDELFKAVVRHFVSPQLDALRALADGFAGTTEELLRGPLRAFMTQFANADERHIVRLLMAEGHKHPDLTAFYFREVVERGMGLLRHVIARGIERGELRKTAIDQFPQLIVAPFIVAIIWKTLFERHSPLDLERLLDAHIDVLLNGLRMHRA